MRRATKWGAAACAVLLALLGAATAIGLVESRARPIERQATIPMSGWPAGATPVRIALLSDIHLGNRAMDPARLRSIVGQVNAARPDLVLIAGDFVGGH